MTPQTDIIIPYRSTRRFPIEPIFQTCIDTLAQHTQNYRLILVDDASDEEGAAFVSNIARQRRDTMLIRSNYQRWFTRTVNLGLRMARTEWVAVINTDTVYGPNWLEELFAVRDEAQQTLGRRVGLVGSVVYEPSEPRRWSESRLEAQDYVTGHCWLLSMTALYEASANRGQPGIYLDEQRQDAIHIKSDVYICWDMNRLGWATIKAYKSEVGHHGGKSWGHALGEALGVQMPAVSDSY